MFYKHTHTYAHAQSVHTCTRKYVYVLHFMIIQYKDTRPRPRRHARTRNTQLLLIDKVNQ